MFKAEVDTAVAPNNKKKQDQNVCKINRQKQSIAQTYFDCGQKFRLQAIHHRANRTTTEPDINLEKMRGLQRGHRGTHQEIAYLNIQVYI